MGLGKWLLWILAAGAAYLAYRFTATTGLSPLVRIAIALAVFILVLVLTGGLKGIGKLNTRNTPVNEGTGASDPNDDNTEVACGNIETIKDTRALTRLVNKAYSKNVPVNFRKWVVARGTQGLSINHVHEELGLAASFPKFVSRKFARGKKPKGKKRRAKYDDFVTRLKGISKQWKSVYTQFNCAGALGVQYVKN